MNDRRVKVKVEVRVVLNPTRREWVEVEDGRLSSPQLAGGSRPSLGDQEKEVKRVWGDGVQTPILSFNQSGRRSCRAERNGTVRVGKGRGRRIHVSNQHELAPKSEKGKKE